MSVEGMLEAWGQLFGRAGSFYEFAAVSLREGEGVESDRLTELGLVEEMLRSSEGIRHSADQVLVEASGDEYVRVSTLLVAAAAVDAMLAADLALLEPDFAEGRRRRLAEEEPGPEALHEERVATLERVNQLFLDEDLRLGSGAALPTDRRQLVEAAHGTTETLLGLAMTPSPRLLQGLLVAMSGGAAEVLLAVEHVDLLSNLDGAAAAVVNRAPRFLREHASKMLALRAEASVVKDVLEGLIGRVPLASLFSRVAACEAAGLRTQEAIVLAAAIDAEKAGALEAELAALLPDYRRHVEWVDTSAKWLRRGASPLAHLVAPVVGHAAICGVFVLGIGYVAYSLADRIDARNLGFADRIEGVVPIVEGGI